MLRTPETLASWSACPVNYAGGMSGQSPFSEAFVPARGLWGKKKLDPLVSSNLSGHPP